LSSVWTSDIVDSCKTNSSRKEEQQTAASRVVQTYINIFFNIFPYIYIYIHIYGYIYLYCFVYFIHEYICSLLTNAAGDGRNAVGTGCRHPSVRKGGGCAILFEGRAGNCE
jgi:hypothetical protein